MKTYSNELEFKINFDFDHQEALLLNKQLMYGEPLGRYFSCTKLNVLGFSDKLSKVLEINNITEVHQLESMSMNDICKLRGMSRKCLNELTEELDFEFEWE